MKMLYLLLNGISFIDMERDWLLTAWLSVPTFNFEENTGRCFVSLNPAFVLLSIVRREKLNLQAKQK